MDYEKAYKAVLKTATQWINDGCTDKEKICLECVFPELRESEDERMMSRIIDGFKNFSRSASKWNNIPVEEVITWLEKQKEQKPISQEDFDTAKHEALWEEQKPAEWKDYKDKVNIPYCSSEQEWSKEDEKMLSDLRNTLGCLMNAGAISFKTKKKFSNWLKSLRPSWKPSEEQMKALQNAVALTACDKELARLYNQLKKL